jgi:hypothetical protein
MKMRPISRFSMFSSLYEGARNLHNILKGATLVNQTIFCIPKQAPAFSLKYFSNSFKFDLQLPLIS